MPGRSAMWSFRQSWRTLETREKLPRKPMRTRSVWLVLLWAAAVAAVRADYVEVRRPVAVRVEPSRDADVVFQAQTGAQLTLLDSDTQNNYYHVEDTSTGQE